MSKLGEAATSAVIVYVFVMAVTIFLWWLLNTLLEIEVDMGILLQAIVFTAILQGIFAILRVIYGGKRKR